MFCLNFLKIYLFFFLILLRVDTTTLWACHKYALKGVLSSAIY